jgi:large subunit ribosomal protein L15
MENERPRRQRPDGPIGSSIRIGFEGGQMPLIRRIPKRGFNNKRHGTRYLPVNIDDLNRFEDGARVDMAAFKQAGLCNGKSDGVKILGTGELTRKLTVSAHAFSASARSKIEAKGGTCELLSSQPVKKAATTSTNQPRSSTGHAQSNCQHLQQLFQDP